MSDSAAPKIIIKHRNTDAVLYEYQPAAAQPTEAQRLAAELYNMLNKERIYQDRALALQIRMGVDQ